MSGGGPLRDAWSNGNNGKSPIGQGYKSVFEIFSHIDGQNAAAASEAARPTQQAPTPFVSMPSVSAGGGINYAGEGDLSLTTILLVAPALVAPGLAICEMWLRLAAAGWSAWPLIAAAVGACVGIYFFVKSFYRYLPEVLAVPLTAAYFAIAYGFVALSFHLSAFWIGVAILVFGICGQRLGKELAENYSSDRSNICADLCLMGVGALLFLQGPHVFESLSARLPDNLAKWTVTEGPWITGTVFAIGFLDLALEHRWTLFAAAAAGVGLSVYDPSIINNLVAHLAG